MTEAALSCLSIQTDFIQTSLGEYKLTNVLLVRKTVTQKSMKQIRIITE